MRFCCWNSPLWLKGGMDDVFAALDAALKREGLSDAAASQLAVGNPSAIKNLRMQRGSEKRINYVTLSKLAEVLGLELYFGPPRQIFTQPQSLAAHDGDFVQVRRFDVQLSAGPGRNGDNAPELAPVAFRAKWMTDAGLIADRCKVLSVNGDSMYPTLSDGDLILVDERQTTVRSMAVYAFVDVSGDARIKRLEKLDDQLLLRSDNPDVTTEIRKPAEANDIRIIGKVVWSGHKWK